MSNRFSVEVNGKEVKNPVLLVLLLVLLALSIVVIVVVAVPVIPMGTFGALVGAAVLVALLITPHFILRVMGRQGFFKKTYDETTNETSFEMNIHGEMFRKVES